MSAQSRRTSFVALTGDDPLGGIPATKRVEIPLFQRDYAQGRPGNRVLRIRTDFLDVLRAALAGDENETVGLDFVYGGIDEGTFRPLDGQQRLTTLFLLHWYVASRSGNLSEADAWTRFSYATRQSARMFCESLVSHPLPDGKAPSDWIKDQPWYLFVWRHDPTIQSMLVMLDAIHERCHDIDPAAAWIRLSDADDPAIWFLLLPLSGLGTATGDNMRAEDLYIKMNSRGKPLTEFENFKAHFEQTIQWSPRAEDFALKVDTAWSDLLWHIRGDDDLIDDEFLRYLQFVTECCEWRDGGTDGPGQRLGPRTSQVFGHDNPGREQHLDFLFRALDVWTENPVADTFNTLFSGPEDTDGETKIRLFFRTDGSGKAPNLFESCCRSYGEMSGTTRVFSLGQTLILYAVVLHLVERTPDFPRRLRVVRNLIEASSDELRPGLMSRIVEDVHRIVRDGNIEAVGALNQAQLGDELRKAAFLRDHPELISAVFLLEDHDLLHGSLGAFELELSTFERRSEMFQRLMADAGLRSDLLAALLAVGEYQRQRTNGRPFLFGTDSTRHDSAWRELLTAASIDALGRTRATLALLLDRIDVAATPARDALRATTDAYLSQCEADAQFDWRYYMVKYPAMRDQGSSTYFDSEHRAMGYSLCVLKAGGRALNGYYRDPYLSAIAHKVAPGVVEDPRFSGGAELPRRLLLQRSGATVRCLHRGFELSAPATAPHAEAFEAVCEELGLAGDLVLDVPQTEVDGRLVDTADRIQIGASLICRLAAIGL